MSVLEALEDDGRFPAMAQVEEEFRELLMFLDRYGAPDRILETGVFTGGTLARFAAAFPEATVVGIDPSPQTERAPYGTMIVTGSSHDEEVRSKALELLGGPPDFVHVDGDHSLEGVLRDALWCVELDVPVVAFHDIATIGHPEIEVFRAWDLIAAADPDGAFEIRRDGGGYDYGFGVWVRRP